MMDFYNKFIERRKDYFDIVAYLLSLYKIRLYKKCTNINELIDFHLKHGKKVTMTGVQPEGRFGALNIEKSGIVSNFKEKPKGDWSANEAADYAKHCVFK